MPEAKKGLIIVHTGPGKGKTTAALGIGFRAVGQGMRVLMVQFIKGSWHYGELETLKRIPEITLVRAGAGFYKIIDDKFPPEVHRRAALEGLFPRGLDCLFVSGTRLAALPRSTRVIAPEDC